MWPNLPLLSGVVGRLQGCCYLRPIFKGCRDIHVLLALYQILGEISTCFVGAGSPALRPLSELSSVCG